MIKIKNRLPRKTNLSFIIAGFFLLSCSKNNCSTPANCADEPNTTGICAAYFESWFYDESTNSCKKIGYSGCGANGFETKEACEECKCNN